MPLSRLSTVLSCVVVLDRRVGWALTYLDVTWRLSSELKLGTLIHKRRYGNGERPLVMTIQSPRLWRGVFCISSLMWASYVAYPLSKQRGPEFGISKSWTPTSFFYSRKGELVLKLCVSELFYYLSLSLSFLIVVTNRASWSNQPIWEALSMVLNSFMKL